MRVLVDGPPYASGFIVAPSQTEDGRVIGRLRTLAAIATVAISALPAKAQSFTPLAGAIMSGHLFPIVSSLRQFGSRVGDLMEPG
jgi:hypothetical protein